MTTYNFAPASAPKNHGIAVEWGICSHYGITRVAHDHAAYDKDSDVNFGDKHMSVKASKFTLMSGSLCEGRETFDGIWELFAERTHSNTFVYGAQTGKAYEMNLDEFKRFVYTFCTVQRESEKNGGAAKIRCRAESKKMLDWLEARAAQSSLYHIPQNILKIYIDFLIII